ncbi:hypothetical protein ACTXJX_12740 [Glutamicibacter ardleyensis]|uniref:hypothetical protein n=1 Tax=Glutamicibacter ardleyensis TaxID=225894 RepID=UPI003FD0AB0E
MSEIVPMGSKMDYAQAMAGSNLLPKHFQGNPANLLYAIEFAEALGMKPIHAITSVHVINGKPSASADLIGSMVRKAGHKLRVTGDETFAEAVLIRADDPDFEFKARWDLSKAKQAGLNTPTWRAYPGAMLKARAITEVCRAGAPDALHGIQHSTEELESITETPRSPRTPQPVEDLGERPTVQMITQDQWHQIEDAAQAKGIESTGAFVAETLGRILTGPSSIKADELPLIMNTIKNLGDTNNGE